MKVKLKIQRRPESAGTENTFTADYEADFARFDLSMPYNCPEEDFRTTTWTIVSAVTLDYVGVREYTLTTGSAADCIAATSSAFGQIIANWPCESELTSSFIHQ